MCELGVKAGHECAVLTCSDSIGVSRFIGVRSVRQLCMTECPVNPKIDPLAQPLQPQVTMPDHLHTVPGHEVSAARWLLTLAAQDLVRKALAPVMGFSCIIYARNYRRDRRLPGAVDRSLLELRATTLAR
jgi:hypothetical protein